MNRTNIYIFAGHYGSGKTNIAINFALWLKKRYSGKVILSDMDIVNPYFKTSDSAELMAKNGIRLIAPPYSGSNLDMPTITAEARAIFDEDALSVVDVGGDDAGAVALGQFAQDIAKSRYEMLLVINKYRYLTRTANEVLDIKRDIEDAAHVKFTGIVNNSNLGVETNAQTIVSSIDFANEVSKKTGLPIVMTTVRYDLYEKVKGNVENPYPITVFKKDKWDI